MTISPGQGSYSVGICMWDSQSKIQGIPNVTLLLPHARICASHVPSLDHGGLTISLEMPFHVTCEKRSSKFF